MTDADIKPIGFLLPNGCRLPTRSRVTGRDQGDWPLSDDLRYAEPTTFFPTENTRTLGSMRDYIRYDGKLEDICFPELTPERVKAEAAFVWNDRLVGTRASN